MDFSLFLRLGWDHILEGYDHILFLIVLLAPLRSVKEVLITVSAFSVTHSIAMLAVFLGLANLNSIMVESVIAITITISALNNILSKKKQNQLYLAGVFGIIHGAGFSSYLKSVVAGTSLSEEFVNIFFGFLVGLELGQVFIAILIYLIVRLLEEFKYYEKISVEVFRMIASVGFMLFIIRLFDL